MPPKQEQMSDNLVARETWAGRECPVDGCDQRFLTANGAGRHLDAEHDEAGRWADNRYDALDGVDDGDVVIYNREIETEWIQSSYAVEVSE